MSGSRMLRRAVPIAVLATVLALVVALPALADSGGASKWKVWTYNASGQAFSGSVPDNAGGAVASFAFPATPDTALLVTDHGSYKGTLLGDLTGESISATWSATTGPFVYYGTCGNTPASVRLFFSATGGPFAETQYWWANWSGGAAPLASGGSTLSASLGNPAQWSDFYGHFGSDPVYAAAFADAVANVTSIGVSFGGGCFFENGVGAPAGASFTLGSFDVS